MLKIFNSLKPFFEDNYRRINIREYARIAVISPPSSSKLLSNLENKKILKSEREKNYIYYAANRESVEFIMLSRIYWYSVLKNSGFIEAIEKEFISPLIVLFGSLSKAEAKIDSDMDLAVFTPSKKTFSAEKFEKKFGRKIQLFIFKRKEDVKNKDLLNSILNGCIINGGW